MAEFGEIYDRNLAAVFGFFAYRVRCRADAEDLTQQTFERALRAWDGFDPARASVATWLLSIARNLLIDSQRRERGRRRQPLGEEVADGGQFGTVEIDARLGLDPELAAALANLSDRGREVVALRFGAELASAEIAELLGLNVANVQQILSRSLRAMRAEMEREGQEGKGPAPTAPSAPSSSKMRPEPQ